MGAASTGTDVPAAGAGWPAPSAAGPVDATVSVPGSKSLTNRYLVLAALAQEPSRLRAPLHSRDTALMARALETLGTIVEEVPGGGSFGPDWVVTPRPLRGPATIDTGLAGTVMRFVPPVAALADGPVRFDGDPAARRRPMATVVTALRELGVAVDDDGDGRLPFIVHGRGAGARRSPAYRRLGLEPVRLGAPARRRVLRAGPGRRARRARRSRAPRTWS